MVSRKKIGIIGGGNMGAAIISGLCRKHNVVVSEADKKRAHFLRRNYRISIVDLEILLKNSQIIILAVKPQNFDELLGHMRPHVNKDQRIISIAAGITTAYIEKRLPAGMRIIRTMPNLPAQVQQGVTAISGGRKATSNDLRMARDLFNTIGSSLIIEEKYIDAITAVSGSGPAYVFHFVECFMAAAKSLGLKADLANEMIMQTIKGSIALMESQDQPASVLRKQVTSKGGTTQAAFDVFEKNKMGKTFNSALKAAKIRAKELSR